MQRSHVSDVLLVDLPRHASDSGELVVIEEGRTLPFTALRMFTVRAGAQAVRGKHAHKRCTQFLVCVHGKIEVECDDGESKKTFLLESGAVGLLIPPSVWATETYVVGDSVLSVLCDRHYEVEDYIRDYGQFLAWRRTDE